MSRVLIAVIVPFLIVLGSLICFLGLKSLGLFTNEVSIFSALSILICVYLSALIVWILNPQQKDIVPSIIAGTAFAGFLLGSISLTNFVSLGLNPSPVFEIFFSQEGLSKTIPYFFENYRSSNETNVIQPIFLYLMVPIATGVLGIFLGCLIQLEKPILSRDRAQAASWRAIVALLLVFLLRLLPKSSGFLFPETEAVSMILGAFFRINSWLR